MSSVAETTSCRRKGEKKGSWKLCRVAVKQTMARKKVCGEKQNPGLARVRVAGEQAHEGNCLSPETAADFNAEDNKAPTAR